MGVISTYFPPDGTHNRQLAGDIIGEGLIALFVELSRLFSLFHPKKLKNAVTS